MQLQIECNNLSTKQQFCWLCNHSFESGEARVIVCDNRGANYGEICPQCLSMGFDWIENEFEQLLCERLQQI